MQVKYNFVCKIIRELTRKYVDFTKKYLYFANYNCNILRMIMIEKVYSVKEIEFTKNKVKVSSYNQPWS